MKKKSIAMVILFNFFIISASSFSMDYMRNTYNTTTMRIAQNLINARNKTAEFLDDLRLKFYSLLRVENLKRISGLDEDNLNSYQPYELENAKNQIGKMIQYSSYNSPKLDNLYMILQGKIQSAEHARQSTEEQETEIEEINAAYDQDQTAQDIETLIREQKK